MRLPPTKAVHHTAVRHAPARHAVFHEDADAEYAQSYYDYHSTSVVEETITSTVEEEHGADWQEAPTTPASVFSLPMSHLPPGHRRHQRQ